VSLVLSRIQLNPLSGRALALAASPIELHHELYGLFDKASSGRILFRVDADAYGPTILLQSSSVPDWSKLRLSVHDVRSLPESKPLDVMLAEGTELSFRLLARPTKVIPTGKGNPRGPRRDLRTDEERLGWIHRKAEASGFRVTLCGISNFSFASIKSNVAPRAKGGTFSAVRFDGELVVVDTELLTHAVANGIGTQKAFGFGLISLGKLS
jgi:CRISPR system Cascade subunit CasE